jgi:hypothetical protein
VYRTVLVYGASALQYPEPVVRLGRAALIHPGLV